MATLTITVEVTDTEQAIMLNDLTQHQRMGARCSHRQERTIAGNVCRLSGLLS